MTDKEIRLQLALAAIASNKDLSDIERFYAWVTNCKENENKSLTSEVNSLKTDFNVSVDALCEEVDCLARKDNRTKTTYGSTISYQLGRKGIYTINDLLEYGRKEVGKRRGIGLVTLSYIDEALNNLYGIESW